ncbi:unnamed protein product [Bursaphelenchus okinawaensis]|uniref:TATA box-binding protein-associated factor RNA polymerase I subunit B n=1 Tax=Bursaphelenchus okinawaensis TaxID=465554 RepID=A0A811LIL3_9BILA|nr:unnamed protein product [Bursaphelenchus okinawaensis]CAG9126638.1 unnamed protein product [Bursaphelenchus okinawaensis]
MHVCAQCGSTQSTILDGLYYCRNCGQQILALREIDLDADLFDNLGPSFSHASILKTPKEKKDKETEVRESKVDILNSTTQKNVDFPRFLATVGKRLTTAVLILVKISRELEKELNVSEDLKEVVIALYQEYLKKLNVAFVDTEVDEDDEKQLKMLFKKNNEELKAETKKAKEEDKRRRKVEKELKKSQMSLFDQVTVEEHLKEADCSVAIDMIKSINTKLSIKSLNIAARVYLGIDMLLSITYLGLLLVGERNILLSDLMRWQREDRFKVSDKQLQSLTQATDYDKEQIAKSISSRMYYTFLISGRSFLVEAYATFSALCGITQVPQVIPAPSNEMILKRFVFDLNLPLGLILRVKILQEFIAEPKPFYDQKWLQNCFPLESDLDDAVRESSTLGPHSFFRVIMDSSLSYFHTVYGIMSFEVRILSQLLFCLVLIYSQDFGIGTEDSDDDEEDNFKMTEWLLQLIMRTQVTAGKSIDDVLSSQNKDFAETKLNIQKRQVNLGKFNRPKKENTALPHRLFLPQSEKIFRDCFPLDHATVLPVSRETLYSPYRSTLAHVEDVDKSSMFLDEKRLEIFCKDFSISKLPSLYEEDVEGSLNDFKAIFPFFSDYKMVPRKQFHILSYDNVILLESDRLFQMYENDKKFYHWGFLKCLNLLSTVIGEKCEVLYLAYLMVEAMFFSPSKVTSYDIDSDDSSDDEVVRNDKRKVKHGGSRGHHKVMKQLINSFW